MGKNDRTAGISKAPNPGISLYNDCSIKCSSDKTMGSTMGWISKLLKKTEEEDEVPAPSTGFHDLEGYPVAMALSSPADLRSARELVHGAALRTAQVYGIPPRWLSFEVVTISDEEKAFFQLQAIVNHWDDYFMAHTYAFERAVIKKIREDNVGVGRALRAVLWRVDADAGCPYDDMPDAAAWSTEAIALRGEARDRINRELFMQHHNALPPALAAAMAVPVAGRDLEVIGDTLSLDQGAHVSGDDYPSTAAAELASEADATGFASTHALDVKAEKKSAVDLPISAH